MRRRVYVLSSGFGVEFRTARAMHAAHRHDPTTLRALRALRPAGPGLWFHDPDSPAQVYITVTWEE